MKNVEFELNVPSGRMVFSGMLLGFEVEKGARTNTLEEEVEKINEVARNGCASAYIGNSCPGVYRVNDGKLIVARMRIDRNHKLKRGPGEYLGQIVTDCDVYCFADAGEYERRGSLGLNPREIKVLPGVYKFFHTSLRPKDSTFVFARITWLREPDTQVAITAKN
jgi:hypothetical protein